MLCHTITHTLNQLASHRTCHCEAQVSSITCIADDCAAPYRLLLLQHLINALTYLLTYLHTAHEMMKLTNAAVTSAG